MNKKGDSTALWVEGIIFTLVFLFGLNVIVSSLNSDYDKNYTIPFADTSGSQSRFVQYTGNATTAIKSGDVKFNELTGITFFSGVGLFVDILDIVINFVSGNWIKQIIGSFGLGQTGAYLGIMFQIVFIFGLVSLFLYIAFGRRG